jgi:hypothetical protein
MAVLNLESHKGKILQKLIAAGPAGLTKSKLGVKDAGSAYGRALKQLEKDRQVANLGSVKKTWYVLSEHFKPLEIACEQIEAAALALRPSKPDTAELLSRKDLEKGCIGEVRKKVDEALDRLVRQSTLLKMRRGRTVYFVHAESLRHLVPPVATVPRHVPRNVQPSTALNRGLVMEAYQRVSRRTGYSNIPIYELQQECRMPLEQIKALILEESRNGNAVLSLGDWSLSSEAVRSAAIDIRGDRYLLVRFKNSASRP